MPFLCNPPESTINNTLYVITHVSYVPYLLLQIHHERKLLWSNNYMAHDELTQPCVQMGPYMSGLL